MISYMNTSICISILCATEKFNLAYANSMKYKNILKQLSLNAEHTRLINTWFNIQNDFLQYINVNITIKENNMKFIEDVYSSSIKDIILKSICAQKEYIESLKHLEYVMCVKPRIHECKCKGTTFITIKQNMPIIKAETETKKYNIKNVLKIVSASAIIYLFVIVKYTRVIM